MPHPHLPAQQLVSGAQGRTGIEDDKKDNPFITHLWVSCKESATLAAFRHRRSRIHDRALPDSALEHYGRVDPKPADINRRQHGIEYVVRS